MRYPVCLSGTVLLLLSSLVASSAPSATGPSAKEKERQRQRFYAVWTKLLQNVDPVPGMEWPPKEEIVDSIGGGSYNACAFCERKDGKIYPMFNITWSYLIEVVSDDDALALTIGHELGHIYHRHILTNDASRSAMARNAYTRTKEYEADLFGARLAIEAGYSLRKGILGKRKGMERIKGLYPSLMAFEVDHPGWDDRFARLSALLDSERLSLWRSMSSYANGVVFLQMEQYEAAEVCFARVVREFPRCHEAWVNLGVARLMQYCEQLSADDLRALGVGQFLGATFYRQNGSLLPAARGGPDEKLWREAVKALRTALDLRRDLALAKANLGLAFLVHPGGKNVGLADAERYLQEAVDAVLAGEKMDPETRVALLVNLGVARLALGSRAEGLRLLKEATSSNPAFGSGAVNYNRAMALASVADRSEQTEAAELFEDYLRHGNPLSGWWTLAYERYQKLCQALGRKARPREKLAARDASRSRPCLAVTLTDGVTIAVTDPVEEVIRRLGAPARKTKENGLPFQRLAFPTRGIELLVDEQQVLAIVLLGSTAPGLPLHGKGLAPAPQTVLRVGMTRKQVEGATGDDDLPSKLTQYGPYYRYYRDLRLGVRYDRSGPEGVVVELILIVIPEERIFGG